MPTARELMSRVVTTVHPRSTLEEAAQLFAREGISGAPVSQGGRIVGVVTRTDLARALATGRLPGRVQPARPGEDPEVDLGLGCASCPRGVDAPAVPATGTGPPVVADFMCREVFTVPGDAPLPEVAGEMLSRGVHRLLVQDQEMVVGIVTATDILRHLSTRGTGPAGGPVAGGPDG